MGSKYIYLLVWEGISILKNGTFLTECTAHDFFWKIDNYLSEMFWPPPLMVNVSGGVGGRFICQWKTVMINRSWLIKKMEKCHNLPCKIWAVRSMAGIIMATGFFSLPELLWYYLLIHLIICQREVEPVQYIWNRYVWRGHNRCSFSCGFSINVLCPITQIIFHAEETRHTYDWLVNDKVYHKF